MPGGQAERTWGCPHFRVPSAYSRAVAQGSVPLPPAPEPWLPSCPRGETDHRRESSQAESQKNGIYSQHNLGELKIESARRSNRGFGGKLCRGDRWIPLRQKVNHKRTRLSERTREGGRSKEPSRGQSKPQAVISKTMSTKAASIAIICYFRSPISNKRKCKRHV